MARVVVTGCPHHLTQRGSRRQETFFEDARFLPPATPESSVVRADRPV